MKQQLVERIPVPKGTEFAHGYDHGFTEGVAEGRAEARAQAEYHRGFDLGADYAHGLARKAIKAHPLALKSLNDAIRAASTPDGFTGT